MSKIFYVGADDQVYGPVTELDVQGWYVNGYLSSDLKFQISESDLFDPKEQLLSLGELRKLNGRTLPFCFSPEKTNREKEQEESDQQLKQELESLRSSVSEIQRRDESKNELIGALRGQVELLVESHAGLLRQVNALYDKKEISAENPQFEKKLDEMNKKMHEQEKRLESMKKNAESTSNQVKMAVHDLKQVKKEMEEQKNRSSIHDSKIEKMKDILTNLIVVLDIHEEDNEIEVAPTTNKKQAAAESEPKNKKPPMKAKKEKTAVETKSVSLSKNGDEICEESKDEEVDQVNSGLAVLNEVAMKDANNFIRDFTELFELYCKSLHESEYSSLRKRNFKTDEIILYLSGIAPDKAGVGLIRDALQNQVRRLSAMPLYCEACNFLLATNHHIFLHIVATNHDDYIRAVSLPKNDEDLMFNNLIQVVFYRFIVSHEKAIKLNNTEHEQMEKGHQLFEKYTIKSCLRPTPQFKEKMVNKMIAGIKIYMCDCARPKCPQNNEEALTMKAMAKHMKTWLPTGTNRRELQDEFEKHLSEGVAACVNCEVAFESLEDYYLHMTSYGHAVKDQSQFTAFMLLWKGQEYWNSMF